MEKQRKYRKLYCPHCDKSLSKSTWYEHYHEFFDQGESRWKVSKQGNLMSGSDFNFGTDSDSDHDEIDDGLNIDEPSTCAEQREVSVCSQCN